MIHEQFSSWKMSPQGQGFQILSSLWGYFFVGFTRTSHTCNVREY